MNQTKPNEAGRKVERVRCRSCGQEVVRIDGKILPHLNGPLGAVLVADRCTNVYD
jgi:hypothetical protein